MACGRIPTSSPNPIPNPNQVWAVACGQILFSLSPGMGTAITMSSYTAPKEDTYRVCLFVALANSAFSLTGGFAIFSILGNLAKRTGRTVAEIAGANGPGLAFVSIADGVVTFGAGANAMAVLLFAIQPLTTLSHHSHSPSTTHHSPLTTHYSPLTTHHSPLTTHHSPLTTHHLGALLRDAAQPWPRLDLRVRRDLSLLP